MILFDLGGVLVEVDSANRLSALTGCPLKEISTKWSNSEYLKRFESGQCDEGAFAEGIVNELSLPISPQEFLCEFSLFLKGFYPGGAELLESLRDRYILACLTDTNPLQWDSMCRRFSVDRYFQRHFLSFEIGSIKPEPKVYEHVLHALDCAPSEIVYFDDRAANVQAGISAGMTAHRVDGVSELKVKLKELALIRA